MRRYEVIGGSPLIGITRAQAAALETRLRGRAIVRAAMRFSDPSIADELASLAGEVSTVVAIVLSPQYSPLLMGGYGRALEEASATPGGAVMWRDDGHAWSASVRTNTRVSLPLPRQLSRDRC